jgi:hypothetical protein
MLTRVTESNLLQAFKATAQKKTKLLALVKDHMPHSLQQYIAYIGSNNQSDLVIYINNSVAYFGLLAHVSALKNQLHQQGFQVSGIQVKTTLESQGHVNGSLNDVRSSQADQGLMVQAKSAWQQLLGCVKHPSLKQSLEKIMHSKNS